jgi:hypothetical protein
MVEGGYRERKEKNNNSRCCWGMCATLYSGMMSNTQTPFGRFFFFFFVFVSIQRNSTGCSPFHLYSFRSAEQRGNIYTTTTTTTKTSYISQ